MYLYTIAALQPRQIVYLVVRRLLPVREEGGYGRVTDVAVRHPRWRPAFMGTAGQIVTQVGDDVEIAFLNQSRRFHLSRLDWVGENLPKLWRYNLHYFDYLQQRNLAQPVKAALIEDWIAKNPPGCPDAWEAYPVSLRIVNWIKFFLATAAADMPKPEWRRSLYQQCAWLEKNIEYHLLANHYFKNAVALCFGGAYFEGADAQRWLALGLKILRAELAEQFLDDGGHFERSPMYHLLCTQDCLDVAALLQSYSDFADDPALPVIVGRTEKALRFVEDLCMPDGEIPLFNDAAFGIAPAPGHILKYGEKTIGYTRKPDSLGQPCGIAKPETGYYVIRAGRDMCVIDCGELGPRYQPGHAHCDTLSYELALDGRRVVVDTGVFDYEAGPRREYTRSTRAHNTITVDDAEQSEVWGVFRVARRARPHGRVLFEGTPEGGYRFEGAHNGYKRLADPIMHRRVIEYDSDRRWQVSDHLLGVGDHTATSYIHLHPGLRVIQAEFVAVFDEGNVEIMRIEPAPGLRTWVEDGWYFPEFGRELQNSVVVLQKHGQAPLLLGYTIVKTTE